ncbi:hypothetical protein ACFLUM_03765, partial [Chloroflexota bacterium]
VAVIAAAIIETLGLSTVHTALWLSDYNAHKRKIDPSAPTWIAIALGAAYMVATVGLVVVLEVWPWLSTYAPALFPLLAVVGTVNLAIIAQQERREASIEAQKAEQRATQRARRLSKKTSKTAVQEASRQLAGTALVNAQDPVQYAQNTVMDTGGMPNLDAVNVSRQKRKAQLLDTLLDIYRNDPSAGATGISRQLGIGRSTVYHYQAELQAAGKVRKNGHGVEVL